MVTHRGPNLAGEASQHTFTVLVGAARSGTTLLRLILDAHAEIGCPAEAGIPSLIANLGRVWWTLDADRLGDHPRDPLTTEDGIEPGGARDEDASGGGPQACHLPELPLEARAAIREAALSPMRHYCGREGKRIYCDKSLDSVHYLEAVHQIFPETRYVLLFRHVMDTVASGIEASPWGFQAYGYPPFIERSPDNFVAALISYWLTHVDAALRWEGAHPELSHRVRYEDLVLNPGSAVGEIFAFLGVRHDPAVLERAFPRARSANGPGDYKVTFTSKVHSESIGHGKRVPVGMVPPPLLEAANDKLKVLGYEPLDSSWNAEPAVMNSQLHEANGWGVRLTGLLGEAHVLAGQGSRVMDSFALVAQDHERLRWVVDLAAGTVRQGDGEVECVITGTAEDLVLLLSGEVNAGVLLRSGRIRHLSADGNVQPDDVIEAARLVLDTLANGRGRRKRANVLSR